MCVRRNLRLTACFSCLALLSPAFAGSAAAQDDPEGLSLSELNALLTRAAAVFPVSNGEASALRRANSANIPSTTPGRPDSDVAGLDAFLASLELVAPATDPDPDIADPASPLARLRSIDPSGYLADYAQGLALRRTALVTAADAWYAVLTSGLLDDENFRGMNAAERDTALATLRTDEIARLTARIDSFARAFKDIVGTDRGGSDCTDFSDADCAAGGLGVGSLSRRLARESSVCINVDEATGACLSATESDNEFVDEVLLSEAAKAELALRERIEELYFFSSASLPALADIRAPTGVGEEQDVSVEVNGETVRVVCTSADTDRSCRDKVRDALLGTTDAKERAALSRTTNIFTEAQQLRDVVADRQRLADLLVTALVVQNPGVAEAELRRQAEAFYGLAGARERSERASVLQEISGQPLVAATTPEERNVLLQDRVDPRYNALRAEKDLNGRPGAVADRGLKYNNLRDFLGEEGLGVLLNPNYDVTTAGADAGTLTVQVIESFDPVNDNPIFTDPKTVALRAGVGRAVANSGVANPFDTMAGNLATERTDFETDRTGRAADPTVGVSNAAADPYAYLNRIIRVYNANVAKDGEAYERDRGLGDRRSFRVPFIVVEGAAALNRELALPTGTEDEDVVNRANVLLEREAFNLRLEGNAFLDASDANILSVLRMMANNILEADRATDGEERRPFDDALGTTVAAQREAFAGFILTTLMEYHADVQGLAGADQQSRDEQAGRPVAEARPYSTMPAPLRAAFETYLRCELPDETGCDGTGDDFTTILTQLLGDGTVSFTEMLRIIEDDGTVTYREVEEDLRVGALLNGEVNAVRRENRLSEQKGDVEAAERRVAAATERYDDVSGDLAAITSALGAVGAAPDGAPNLIDRLAPALEVGERLEDQRSGLAMAASLGDVHVSPGRRVNMTVSSAVYDGRYPAVALQMGMRLGGAVIMSGGVAYGIQSSEFGGRFSLAGEW